MSLKFLSNQTTDNKIGIGTNVPNANLEVSFPDNTNIQRWSYSPAKTDYYLELDSYIPTGGVVGYSFDMKNAGTSYNDVLTMREGKVGMGTRSPGGKLDIAYTGTGGTGTLGIGEGINIYSLSPNMTFNDNSSSVDNYAIHLNQNEFTLGRYTSSTAMSPDLVLKSGSVGVGYTNPNNLSVDANNLVVGSFTGNNGITILSSASSGYGSIYFADATTGNKVYSGFIRYQQNISDMTFGTNESERMRLTLEGYLGIGTDDPNYTLDVNGIIRSENSSEVGTLYLGNTAQSQIPGGAIIGQRSPNYSSTGNLLFQVPTWGANTDYGLTTQMSIEVTGSDTKASTISMIPFGGKVLINATSSSFGDQLYVNGDGYTTGGWRTGTGATFIGELTNASGILTIQADTNRDIQFGDVGSPNVMYIDNSAEKIGIGETAPATKLEVAGGILGGLPRLNTTQRHPMGHYAPGETLFEIDPTWDTGQLQSFFNSTNVSWTADADAPGGYAITITGQVGVGGVYGSGFPYIPVDNDGVYYVECYIKNVGTGQTHYMGGNEFNENFGSTGGNPGSYAYFVMSNTNPGNTWTKVTGYISGFDANTTGKFELLTKYWTPLALFNWGAGTGTRACVISGWKIIRADSPGDRYFDGNVGIKTDSPSATLTVNGEIEILKDDITSVNEGGHLTLRSGSSYSYRYNIDNHQDQFRLFKQDDATAANGAVLMKFDSSGNLQLNEYGLGTLVSDSSGNITVSSGGGQGGPYLKDTTDTFTGSLTIIGDIRGSGQQLILNAGESYSYATGQTAEYVYANAEQGLEVNSSPDNWSTGWAGRNTTRIGKADGSSTFPGNVTTNGYLTLTGQATPQIFMDSTTASTPIWTMIARNDGYFLLGRSGVSNDFYFDPSGNATFAGNVSLGDSSQIQLGTGNDAQIDHTGSHLFIDNSVGTSYIRNTSTGDILLRNSTGGDIQFDNEFAGNILFNTSNVTRLTINSSGNSTFAGTIDSGAITSTGIITGTIFEGSATTVNLMSSGSEFAVNLDDSVSIFGAAFTGTPRIVPATTAEMDLGASGNKWKDLHISGDANFGDQAFATTATSSGDASSTLTTKGYVDSLITASASYRGTWDPDVSLNSGYGNPNLSTVTQTSGYYYICSDIGTATPNGTGCEPDSWAVGDWVVWNDDVVDCAGTGTGAWQKIDNSSVLSGTGRGQTVALWEGLDTVVDSETLGNAPITVASGNAVSIGVLTSGSTGSLIVNQEGGLAPVAKFLSRTNKAIVQISDNDTTGYVSSEGGFFSLGSAAGVNEANINISTTNSNVGIGISTTSDGDLTLNAPKLHVRGTDTSGAYNLVARFQGGNDADSTGAAILINHSNDRGLLIEAGRKDGDREVAYFNLISSGATVTPMLTMGKFGSAYNIGIGTTNPATELQIGDYTDSTEAITIATLSDGTGRINFYDNNTTEGGSIRMSGKTNGATMVLAGRWNTDTDRFTFDLSNGAVKFNNYDSTNNTGTPTYLLGTDASGNVVKTLSTPSPITSQAASLYDLIPNGAFTTTYAFTSTAGVYAEVMSGDDVITATGTYSVQMLVNDHAVGGTQYDEKYSGVMTWHATSTNDAGVGAISEIVFHRSGHAGNQGITYLRTRETTNADNNELKLEIMCNRTYTGASNVVFKFVRLI